MRSDSELAVLPAEQLRAIATPGDHHQLGVVAQPALGNAMWFDAWVKQAQILVTDLDQMGLLGEGLDPPRQRKIRLDVEPHVRVEEIRRCACSRRSSSSSVSAMGEATSE